MEKSAPVLALILSLCIALPAGAGRKSKSLYRTNQQPVGIALDPSGRVHFSWQATDFSLHHTWIENGRKRDEVVDATSDCGWWSSIALDSAGRPHIAYHAERLIPTPRQVLVHAHFDGAVWRLEELGPGGYSTAIAIDADEHPHIVHALGAGGLEYLRFDGAAWQRETPSGINPTWFTPMSLALDSSDKAHVALEDAGTRRPVYATNAGGGWSATELASATGPGGSVTLDSLDQPHVALPLAGLGTIRYAHFDGMQWISEDVYDPNDVPPGVMNAPEAAALALDADDRPQVVFVTNFFAAGGNLEVALHAYHDGFEWRGAPLRTRGATPFVGLVSGADGVMHAVYSQVASGESQRAKYVRVALHDLAGEWTGLGFTEQAGISTVAGVLHVRNDGDDKSQSSRIALYLSDDSTLDAGDLPVAYRKRVRALKAGRAVDVNVKFKTSSAVAGRFLIAVLDPLHERDEADRTDDTISGALPN